MLIETWLFKCTCDDVWGEYLTSFCVRSLESQLEVICGVLLSSEGLLRWAAEKIPQTENLRRFQIFGVFNFSWACAISFRVNRTEVKKNQWFEKRQKILEYRWNSHWLKPLTFVCDFLILCYFTKSGCNFLSFDVIFEVIVLLSDAFRGGYVLTRSFA